MRKQNHKTYSSHVGISVMITFSVGINTMASLRIVKFMNKCDARNSSGKIIIMIMIGNIVFCCGK